MSWRRTVLLAVGGFLCAYAWAYSLGTTQQPEPSQTWTPATASEPVPTEDFEP